MEAVCKLTPKLSTICVFMDSLLHDGIVKIHQHAYIIKFMKSYFGSKLEWFIRRWRENQSSYEQN